jgi:hypothetical protein
MTITSSITLIVFATIGQTATKDRSQQAITTEYAGALVQSITDPGDAKEIADPNKPPPAVDPAASLEGIAFGVQPDDLTPGYVLIDGDIQVRKEALDVFLNNPTAAVFFAVVYWSSTVPYDFAANVNATNQQAAINAMNAISARVGVTFVPHTTQADWIRFNASSFNNSPIGPQGGMQIINITSWGNQIIIVHEIYHSLGFWHEQSSPVRDTYVTINSGNICGASSTPGDPCNANVCQLCADSGGNFISCAFNFNIANGAGVWGPYDFDSFMHYGRTAFSCNGGDTITVKPPWNSTWQNAIGQRTHFSLIDELSCRGIYPFAGDRWLRAGAGGSNSGTFFDPYNGTFTAACNSTPTNGTLLIDPGAYSGIGTYSEAKIIRGTYGLVTIGS